MNMKRLIVLTLVILLSALCFGGVCRAYAEETLPPEQVTEGEENTPQNPDNEAEEGNDIQKLVDSFVAYLKDKYGEDYELYYNRIIEEWGSVEAYLLSLGENLPEDYKNGWEKFVAWLGEYASVWAPALAVVLVIVAALFGKKLVHRIAELFKKLFQGSNQQSSALIAVIRAQKALMGTNEKFSENVKELEEAEKRLEQ
jgi:hypothetical protein